MAFQFKQFKVEDDQSAMKVGTDAVLLGALIETKNTIRILEIGTGSGIIALILAQKSSAKIEAIDIDPLSIEQASQNFQHSNWASRLKATHISLQAFCKNTVQKYDLIVSNPPFFDQSLKSPDKSKNISKHTDSLNFSELAHGIKQSLSPDGKACLILPPNEAAQFLNEARIESLFCNKKMKVIPVIGRECNRWIFEISSIRSEIIEEEITIRDKNHNYTQEYIQLTKDFYLNF
jgi:tRNA1Val (adenine37-N6)-methyltransferase